MTDVPASADFRAVTEDDTPAAFAKAAAVTLSRDALWRDKPPLAADWSMTSDACPSQSSGRPSCAPSAAAWT